MRKEPDKVICWGWIGIWSVVILWGIFWYLLLYHGWIFGIHH